MMCILAVALSENLYSSNKANPKQDTLHLTANISKQHILLQSANSDLHVLPPEKSFKFKYEDDFFGLVSEKYPDINMRFVYSGVEYHDNDSLVNLYYKMLKKIPAMIVNNDFIVWAYKYQLKDEADENYIWSVYVKNDIAYAHGTITYHKKYDKVFDKNMEKLIKNIILSRRTDIKPTANIVGSGDYSILGLKFVPKMSVPVAYFTEDSKTFVATKHSKMFAFATPNGNRETTEERLDALTRAANQILSLSKLNDTIIIEQLGETSSAEHDWIWVKGTLQNNPSRSFIAYYSDFTKASYYVLFGICDANEKEEFFAQIDKFRATVTTSAAAK